MNPAYPAEVCAPEAVALQGRGPEGFPGQPGYPTGAHSGQPQYQTGVQYTTVNIPAEPPNDHIIWSLCNFFYGNIFCIGLAAFIFSIKARDRKVVGDLQGARHYGSTSRCLNIWATVLNSIIVLISLITIIVVFVNATSYSGYNSYNSYNKRYYGY